MKKKVLFLLSSLSQGGSERQMINTALLLAQNDVKVTIVTYHKNDFYGLADYSQLINYVVLDAKSVFQRMLKLRTFVKQSQADYVITLCGIPSFYTILSLLGNNKTKIILNWRNNNTSLLTGIYGVLYTLYWKKIQAIVCNSFNGKNLWLKHRRKDAHKIHVIYNLVSINNSTSHVDNFHDDKKFTIVVAARVCADKNPEGLIEAISNFPSDVKDRLQISWFGRPDNHNDYFASVEEKLKNKNVGEILKFLDPIKDIHKEMVRADAVGLFSHREGFPNVICEAMLLGKPIIMTPVSDYKILCQENGVLCEDDSAKKISEGIIKMMNKNSQELMLMGDKSLDMASQILDFDIIKNQWLELVGE